MCAAPLMSITRASPVCLANQSIEHKNRTARSVPLNEMAMAVLRKQLGKHSTRVFTYRGQPIEQVGTKAWTGALARAGLELPLA